MSNLRDVFGEFFLARTDWAASVGQFCHMVLLEDPWPGSGPYLDGGVVHGRIVGLDGNGVWFECIEHVHEVRRGERSPGTLYHFFIPFSIIRSVATPAIKVADMMPEDFPGLRPRLAVTSSSTEYGAPKD